jgi:hypothetical protein
MTMTSLLLRHALTANIIDTVHPVKAIADLQLGVHVHVETYSHRRI